MRRALVQEGTDDVYEAMDWLLAQKGPIEKKLARRHLREGGIAMYELSSSWVEVRATDRSGGPASRH